MSGSWPSYNNQGGQSYQGGYSQPYQTPSGYTPQGAYPQHNYQASYPQYHPQHYGPPQNPYPYGGPHYGSYPQTGLYTQPQPPYQAHQPQQQIAKPSPSTCYNCGDPNHIAQDCPEPRRAVPHGSLNENRAAKRFKPNYIPPVITKYPVPPHLQATQGLQPNYTPTPSGPVPFANHGSPPYAANPNLANSPPHPYPHSQQWHGSYQTPNYQAQPQFGAQYPPPHSHGPSPMPHYGPPHPYPIPGQAQAPFTPPYGPDQQWQGRKPSTGSANTQRSSTQPPVQPQPIVSAPGSRQVSIDQSVSMESTSDADNELDDLSLLDIPEVPVDPEKLETTKPILVEQPLPAILETDDVDALRPLDNDTHGRLQSKYIDSGNLEALLPNARSTKAFDLREDDPIFAKFEESESAQDHSPRPYIDYAQPEYENNRHSRPRSATPIEQAGSKTPVYRFDPSELSPGDAFAPTPADFDSYQEPMTAEKHERYDSRAPPPPPPPPHHQQRKGRFHGAPSPTRSQSWSTNQQNYDHNGANAAYPSTKQCSPTQKSFDRKRKLSYEDGSGRSDERRRQPDDILPKHKRNQPKVAAAYSRRW